jgi:hypothetical protein
MTWFWLNIPLATCFFLAWTLIPLWMVFKQPDTGSGITAGEPAITRTQAQHTPGAPRAHGHSRARRSVPSG